MGATKKQLPAKIRKNATTKTQSEISDQTNIGCSGSTSKETTIATLTTTSDLIEKKDEIGDNNDDSGHKNNSDDSISSIDRNKVKSPEPVLSRIIKKKQLLKKVPATVKSGGIPKITKSEKSKKDDTLDTVNTNIVKTSTLITSTTDIATTCTTTTTSSSVSNSNISNSNNSSSSSSSNNNSNNNNNNNSNSNSINNINNSTTTAISINSLNAAAVTVTSTTATTTTSLTSSSTSSLTTTTSQEKLPLDNKSKALDKMLKSLDIKISGFKDIIPNKAGLVAGGSISENVKTKYRAAKISFGPFSFQRAFSNYKKPRDTTKKSVKTVEKKTNQTDDETEIDEKSNDNIIKSIEINTDTNNKAGTTSAKIQENDKNNQFLSKSNDEKTEHQNAQKRCSGSPKKSPNKISKQKIKESEELDNNEMSLHSTESNDKQNVEKKFDEPLMEEKNPSEIIEDTSSKSKEDFEKTLKSSSQNKNSVENLKTKEKLKRSKFGSLNATKKVTKKKLSKAQLAEDGGSTTADTGYSSFVSSKSDTQSEAAQSVDLSAKSVFEMESAKMEDNNDLKIKPKKGRPKKEISDKSITKSKDSLKTSKIKKQFSKIKDKITEMVVPKQSSKESFDEDMDDDNLPLKFSVDQKKNETSKQSPAHVIKENQKDKINKFSADIPKITAQTSDEAQLKKNSDEPQKINSTTSTTTSNILTPVDILSDESDSEAVVKAYISEIIKTVDDSEGKYSDECPSPKKKEHIKDSKNEGSINVNAQNDTNSKLVIQQTNENNNKKETLSDTLSETNEGSTTNKPKMTTVRERLQQKYVTAFKFNNMVPKKKETLPTKITLTTQKGKKGKLSEPPVEQKSDTTTKKTKITDIYDFKTESEDEENIKMNLLNQSSLKMKSSIDNAKSTKDNKEERKPEEESNPKSHKESFDYDSKTSKSTPKSSANNTPVKQQKISNIEPPITTGSKIIKKFAKPPKLAAKSNLINRTIKSAVTKAKAKKGKSKWFVEVSNSESESDEDGTQKSKKKIILMPKRRMASLNALAKVQCLYENESRTSNELGLSKTMQIPKIRTIASASSSDEEKEVERRAAEAAASLLSLSSSVKETLKDTVKENEKETKKQKEDKDIKDHKDNKDHKEIKEKDKCDSKGGKLTKEATKKTDLHKEANKKIETKEIIKKGESKESSGKKSESSTKKAESIKKPIIEIKSEEESEKSEEEVEVKRELRNVPGLRGVGKHWDFNESFESANESDISSYQYDGDHKPKNKTKKFKLKQKLAKIKQEKLAAKTKPNLSKFKSRKLIKNKISKLVKAKAPKINKAIKNAKGKSSTKQIIIDESDSSDDEKLKLKVSPEKESAIKNKKKLPFKKRKLIKHDEYLSTLKGLARKRMASLNASALVAATYELEGHLDKNLDELDCYEVIEEKPAILTPKKVKDIKKDVSIPAEPNMEEDKEPKDMDIEEITLPTPQETEKLMKENRDSLKDDRDDKDTESIESIKDFKENSKDGSGKDSLKDQPTSRPTSSSVVIVQDTDVTITGVYVNATTGSSQEAYCKMQYRVQSSVTEERVVSNIEGGVPPKSYTPLGALSNMRPPGVNEGQQISSNASQTASSTQISSTSEQHSSTALSIYQPPPPQPPAQPQLPPVSVASTTAGTGVLGHHHHHHHHHAELNQLQHSGGLVGVSIEHTSPGSLYTHHQSGQPPPPQPPPQLSAAQHLSHYGMPPPPIHHPQYDPTQQYQYSGPGGSQHHYQHSSSGPGPPPQSMHHHPHYGPPLPPPPSQLPTSSQNQGSVTSNRCDSPTMQQQQHQQQQSYHSSLYQSNAPGGPPHPPPSGLSGSSLGGSQSAFCAPNVQQSHQDLSGK